MRTVLCSLSLLFFGTSRLDPVADIHPDSIGAETWRTLKLGRDRAKLASGRWSVDSSGASRRP